MITMKDVLHKMNICHQTDVMITFTYHIQKSILVSIIHNQAICNIFHPSIIFDDIT